MTTATNQATITPAYMRPAEAAKYTSVAERTLRMWMRRGAIPYHKMGKRCVLFRVADLDKALGKFKVNAVSDAA